MAEQADNGSAEGPPIDYLAKDFHSFRRLMLDRLAVTMPDWQERNPADLGHVLIELLAYDADHLSYYQDAVGTEAYLGTARLRTSVRRHARLLDYPMHDGCNARAWVAVDFMGTEQAVLPMGTRLLTRTAGQPTVLAADQAAEEYLAGRGAQVFETLHDVTLQAAHSRMRLVPSQADADLPAGATSARVESTGDADDRLRLQVGDVVIFEEAPAQQTPQASASRADPTRRQAVRMSRVELQQGGRQAQIEWGVADALSFPFRSASCAVFGNVVLVDHGCTLPQGEPLPPLPSDPQEARRYRPALSRYPLTQQPLVALADGAAPFDPSAPARAALDTRAASSRPCVVVTSAGGRRFSARRDLLSSDASSHAFVVEFTDDQRACLRFGDGVYGVRPAAVMQAQYRIGNGRAGNVGAESICHVETQLSGIHAVRNPLPAQGGTEPESLEEVRMKAPRSFRQAERAVTPDDYAGMACRHPQVRMAQAERRWTGSYYTIQITVQRRGGQPLDRRFRQELRTFLDRYRMVGHDVQIESPIFVPLDIVLRIEVAPGCFRSVVQDRVGRVLGNTATPAALSAFFHPDRFALAQPVYLSQLLSTVMSVPGVRYVTVLRFARLGDSDKKEQGVLVLSRGELPLCDNDPGMLTRGAYALQMVGGL